MSAVLERRSALPEPEPRASSTRGWTLALAGAMVVAAGLILYFGRGTGFFFDEWNWIVLRRGWNANALLEPHNQHLSLVPVAIYKLLFVTVGLKSYLPYRLVALAMHLACAGLLYVYARPRIGAAAAWALAAVLLFLGPAWQDIFWAFQIGYLGSLVAGLGALLALDRRRDGLATVLLVVSIASSSLGIPILVALAVEVFARRHRWWVVVVPVVLYGLWYLGWGVSEGITEDNILSTPAYVADAAAAAVGAVFGLSADWGRVLAAALAALVAWRALTLVARPWRLIAVVALPLAFWVVTGFARAEYHEPGASRYLYPGALFVLVVMAEAGSGLRFSRRALILAALVLLGITVSNVGQLRNGGGWMRDRHSGIQGGLAAVRLAGGAPVGFEPAPNDSPQITADQYAALAAKLPAPPADPSRQPPLGRAATDNALVRLGEIALKRGAGACGAPAKSGEITVNVPAGGLTVDASGGDVTVAVRRFAEGFGPLGTVDAGATSTVAARADASSAPWVAKLTIGGQARVCGV